MISWRGIRDGIQRAGIVVVASLFLIACDDKRPRVTLAAPFTCDGRFDWNGNAAAGNEQSYHLVNVDFNGTPPNAYPTLSDPLKPGSIENDETVWKIPPIACAGLVSIVGTPQVTSSGGLAGPGLGGPLPGPTPIPNPFAPGPPITVVITANYRVSCNPNTPGTHTISLRSVDGGTVTPASVTCSPGAASSTAVLTLTRRFDPSSPDKNDPRGSLALYDPIAVAATDEVGNGCFVKTAVPST